MLSDAICRFVSADDFLENTTLSIDLVDLLDEIAASGEIPQAMLGEDITATSTFRLKTFGRIIGIDRQTMRNAGQQIVSDVGRSLGRLARRTFEKSAVELLVGAAEGNTEFFRLNTTDRKPNVIVGALDEANLSSAIEMLRGQTVGNGSDIPCSFVETHLAVGESDASLAQKLCGENGDYSHIQVISSPWLHSDMTGGSGDDWYLCAVDPANAAPIVCGLLDGRKTPTIRTQESTTILGWQSRVVLSWGHALGDPRTVVRGRPA